MAVHPNKKEQQLVKDAYQNLYETGTKQYLGELPLGSVVAVEFTEILGLDVTTDYAVAIIFRKNKKGVHLAFTDGVSHYNNEYGESMPNNTIAVLLNAH